MARGQLLLSPFPLPLEAGLCPYIAGPALPVSAIARALLPFLLPECVEWAFSEVRQPEVRKYGHLTYGVSSANPATLVADITTKANPSRDGDAKPKGLSKSAGSRAAERGPHA
jgi:hypothetical protein